VLIGFVEATVLQHDDPFAQSLLELSDSWKTLIEALGFFDAVDIGPQRFGQIDCGEYLHDRTYDPATLSAQVDSLVGDIRHLTFNYMGSAHGSSPCELTALVIRKCDLGRCARRGN